MNPLNYINSVTATNNPKWTCKHLGITIVDGYNYIYRCSICCNQGNIRVIPNSKNAVKKRVELQEK
jgi:hypothetical protein